MSSSERESDVNHTPDDAIDERTPLLNHQSYLLRLTRTTSRNEWRVMLYSAESGVRRHFATIEHFNHYMQELVSELSLASKDEKDESPCQK